MSKMVRKTWFKRRYKRFTPKNGISCGSSLLLYSNQKFPSYTLQAETGSQVRCQSAFLNCPSILFGYTSLRWMSLEFLLRCAQLLNRLLRTRMYLLSIEAATHGPDELVKAFDLDYGYFNNYSAPLRCKKCTQKTFQDPVLPKRS